MKSLFGIQQELKAKKDKYNKFGKYQYRSAESILEALKPLLDKYKATLIIEDEIKEVGSYTFVESRVTLKEKDEEITTKAQAGIEKAGGMALPQAFGSASSYAKKYALGNLFLIDDTEDADSTNTHDKEVKKPSTTNPAKSRKKKAKQPVKDINKVMSSLKTNKDKTLQQLSDYYYLLEEQKQQILKAGLAKESELEQLMQQK